MIVSHLFFRSLSSEMAAVPTAYIVIREPQSQEHWYPLNQPQTTQTTGRPPVLKSAEFQRVLKESKTLGVSEMSHCRLGAK